MTTALAAAMERAQEQQRNFLLSPAAKAYKPSDAAKVKKDEAFDRLGLIYLAPSPFCILD